jgi:hypothetical protein
LVPGLWAIAAAASAASSPLSRLAGEFADGREALVDGRGAVALLFEPSAVGLHGGVGEGWSSLLFPPSEEAGERRGVGLWFCGACH